MCDERLKTWVATALKHEDLNNYSIEVQGKTGKGDGYLGNITFVTVSGETKIGISKIFNLVIKASKESTNFRKQFPVQQAFEKEIFIYDQVKPAFEDLLRENGSELPQVTPHCFATFKADECEVLIFENLRSKGYGLWDRKIPMSHDHIKMILEAYGKWHALSFALKKKRPSVFKQLTKGNVNIFCEFMIRMKMVDYTLDIFNKSKETLVSSSEKTALEKLNFSRDDIEYIFNDLFLEEPEYHVILHGDCWTNNFMFKFKENSTKPLDARIIDWQCSGLASPAIDLSHFLYTCCSKEDFDNFSVLLEIYYNSFSEQLRILGIDAEEVYSFRTLNRHWKRFSKFGIVISSFALRFSLCEAEDAPDFEQTADREDMLLNTFNFELKNENVYLERIKHNLLHYAQST